MALNAELIEHVKQRVNSQPGAAAKYVRLSEAMGELIHEGRLSPGQQLPNDKSLASMLGISLGTVQKALVNLSKIGVLTRAPRRGTVVSEKQVKETDIFVFRFHNPETGALIPPRVRTLSVAECNMLGPWKSFLKTERIIRFERLMQIEMEPPVYSEVFIPFAHGESLLGKKAEGGDFTGFSVHRHIELCHGAPTLRTESKVYFGSVKPEAAKHLMLDNDTGLLVWEIQSFTIGNRPASYQRIHVPLDHRPLEFHHSLQR